ncbi:hypothetical protein LzC2_40560 [Planctomycetes bacterium LzC2]|uniref:Uncharacterized protein n=2 Tax=Alienimonas chondri TaxID=2681879 RepID=A0ABX1VJD7_9PLAN|nr:hypothetical protein [Alienimonas chondri]
MEHAKQLGRKGTGADGGTPRSKTYPLRRGVRDRIAPRDRVRPMTYRAAPADATARVGAGLFRIRRGGRLFE